MRREFKRGLNTSSCTRYTWANSRHIVGAWLSAIDVTAKTFFERLYLVLGLAPIGALSQQHRWGVSAVRPAAATRGWSKVARHLEQHNRCAFGEPTCTWFGGCSQRRRPAELSFFAIACNQKYTMRSNIFVLDRIVSQIGTGKGVLKRPHPWDTHHQFSINNLLSQDCFSHESAPHLHIWE